MTTIVLAADDCAKAKKRQYDIARRAVYAERKKELRKAWKSKERAATAKRKETPQGWATTLFANARYRAKIKGIEFSISIADVEMPDVCPVLGIKLAMGSGSRSQVRDCSPSLDRIDNSLGYIPGNVRVVSWRANRLKSDATMSELEAILRYMKESAS